jgi:hypothetical protein
VLREVGGLSYHELGQALGVSHASVESLLFRARRHVRGLVAAASPLALRDDLARLIPGFDPGNAGLAARVVSLPLALKLATAAVSVGVVTTGAGQLPQHHPRPQAKAQTEDTLVGSAPIERTPVVLVRQGRRPTLHAHGVRREDGDRSGRVRHREAEPAETEASHRGSNNSGVDGSGSESGQGGGSGSGSSGSGSSDTGGSSGSGGGSGSGSSGSGHSGSSGGDSQPDEVDH